MPRRNESDDCVDPAFGLPTPLLFAHRGGKWEAPESTALAFDHALDTAHADVLEIDVQVTRDGRPVVWHGPGLENVIFRDGTLGKGRSVRELAWEGDLAEGAWVVDPPEPWGRDPVPEAECIGVEDRLLLPLDGFLERYRGRPINIEIKSLTESSDNVRAIVNDLQTFIGKRPDAGKLLLVVIASPLVSWRFDRAGGADLRRGLSATEALRARLAHRFLRQGALAARAYQVPRLGWLTSQGVVASLHRAEAAVHVFITRFSPLVPALDGHPRPDPAELEQGVAKILDRGVDGIMTDRPAMVRAAIDSWRAAHGLPGPTPPSDQGTGGGGS